MSVCERYITDSFALFIKYDECGISPRKFFDNLGTIVGKHRQYNVGDRSFNEKDYDNWDDVLLGECGSSRNILYLPVYMYNHSTLALSTGSFIGRAHHAEWDSGQVGWTYVEKKKVREEYGIKKITKAIREKVYEVLGSEVEILGHYLNGDTYGFTLHEYKPEDFRKFIESNNITKLEEIDEIKIEDLATCSDPCWGYYGYDIKKNGMLNNIPQKYHEKILNYSQQEVEKVCIMPKS